MIRKLKKEDLAACANIYRRVFSLETWGVSWSEERALMYLTDFLENKKFVGFVAVENNEIVGSLFASIHVASNADEFHLDELFVEPSKQGQGIGRELLVSLKEYAIKNSLAGIVLYTNQQAPAAKFYEKNDFLLSSGTICMYWIYHQQVNN